jgi:multiple sugar transport system substrate-binding protein
VPHFAEGSLFTWGLSFGGSFYDIDAGFYTNTDPRIVDALTWMTSFGIDLVGLEEARAFRASAGADAADPFISGMLSMKVTGNWRLGDIARFNPDLNFAVTPIPTPTGDNFTTFIGGRALLIPAGKPDHLIEAAWEAIKFMTMHEQGQTPMAIAGNFPASPQFTEQMYHDNPFFMMFAEVLPYGYARPVSLASNMFFERFVAAPDLVFAGEEPYDVLRAMDDLLNDELVRARADR